MWRPGLDEVIAARLATRRARSGEVALSGASAEELERLDMKLRETRFFQALFEFERPLFDRIVAAMREGHRVGRTELEALEFIGPELERLIDRDLPHASDAAARAFFGAFLGVARSLRERDPARCGAMIGGAPAGGGIHDSGALLDAPSGMLDAIADVIVAARLDRREPPREAEMQVVLAGIVRRVKERGRALEALGDVAPSPPSEACDAAIAMAEEIIALPPDVAGPLVRFLSSR